MKLNIETDNEDFGKLVKDMYTRNLHKIINGIIKEKVERELDNYIMADKFDEVMKESIVKVLSKFKLKDLDDVEKILGIRRQNERN